MTRFLTCFSMCALVVTSAIAHAGGIPDATYLEIKQAYPSFAAAETTLNRTYELVMAEVDPLEAEALRRQQRAWTQERGAVYETLWTADKIDEPEKVAALTKMASIRTVELLLFEQKFNRTAVETEPDEPAKNSEEQNSITSAEPTTPGSTALRDTGSNQAEAPMTRASVFAQKNENSDLADIVTWAFLALGLLVLMATTGIATLKWFAWKAERTERRRLYAIADVAAAELCGHAAGPLNRLSASRQVHLRKKELTAAEAALRATLATPEE